MVQYLESLRWVKSFYLCKGFPCGILPHGFYMFGDFVWRGKRLLFLIISVFGKDSFSLHVWGRKDDITRKMSLPLCPPSFSSSCKSVCLARRTLRARGKVENGKLFSHKKTDMKEEKKREITNGNFLKEGHTVRNEFP